MAIPEFNWKSSIPTIPSLKNGPRGKKEVIVILKNRGVDHPKWDIGAPLFSPPPTG